MSASEDLMREHGVLNRILLVYEEGLRRMAAREQVAPGVFHTSASLVRKFVEDYHEALEEKFIFPEFERRGTLIELVRTLCQQHKAGRTLTDTILRNSEPTRFDDKDSHQELVRTCEAFIRTYRPHEAREDTVLFPALHGLLSAELEKKVWDEPIVGLLITAAAPLLVANLFDLSSISTMGSGGFLLIFASVNGANVRAASQTDSRWWISAVGVAACFGALGVLLWHTAIHSPRRLWVLATMLGLSFFVEATYRLTNRRAIRL